MKSLLLSLIAVAATAPFRGSNAFSLTSRSPVAFQQRSTPSLAMVSGGGAADNELSSLLSGLDHEWKKEQRKEGDKSRWTQLVIPNDERLDVTEEPAGDEDLYIDGDIVYLLEPPNGAAPSCIISFVGGAGLGQFPELAYNEFLTRVSDKLNAAILTPTYNVGLDHFKISGKCGNRLRRAILHCQQARQFPSGLPSYSLAHSLGCKLQTINIIATGQDYDGIGFISYNNFGFSRTMSMASSFMSQLRGNEPSGASADPFQSSGETDTLSSLFSLAGGLVGAIGIDFSPTSQETDRAIHAKYGQELQSKTRLFVFDSDNMDTSQEFVECCRGSGPAASGLPGIHLTPVYMKYGESASFGTEEGLSSLVDEVCGWINGKGPTRGPWWSAAGTS